MTKQVNLRDIVRDEITGFEGMAVAVTHWINGCCRIMVQPQGLQDNGKPKESHTFDVEQLVIVEATKAPKDKPHGGPRDDAKAMERN